MRDLVIVLVLIMASCKEGPRHQMQSAPPVSKIESIEQRGDLLEVRTNRDNYTLEFWDSMMIYTLSPDSTAIIVNSRKTSNIQISQMYHLSGTGSEKELVQVNLSTIAWDSISKQKGIDTDAILFPKTLANFSSKNSITLQVKGRTELGNRIDEEMELHVHSIRNHGG